MAGKSRHHDRNRENSTGEMTPAASLAASGSLWTGNFIKIWVINLALCMWANMLSVSYPFYVIHLGGTELLVGVAAGGFFMASLVMRPISGWMMDNVSRSSLLVIGVAFLIAAMLLLLLFPALAIVLIVRIISGILFAGATTSSTTNACDAIPPSRFGEGLGFLGLSNTLATALGPLAGLAIIGSLGYHYLFAACICVLLLAALFMRGFIYKKIGQDDSQGRKKIKLSSLFNADALPASVVMLFSALPFGGVTVFIALYGEYYNLGSGAWFYALLAIGTGSTRLLAGRIADRKGESPMIMTGNLCFLLALALLLPDSSACYYISGLFFGVGFGISIPAMQSMAMRISPPGKRGSASSTYQSSYDISAGLGGLLAGGLVTIWGYRPMFASLSVFLVVSTLVYVFWASKTPSAFKVYMRNQSERR